MDMLYDRALRSNTERLARFILKHDADSGDEGDDEEDAFAAAACSTGRARNAKEDVMARGLPPELREVRQVLWQHWTAVMSAYDYYCALGGANTKSCDRATDPVGGMNVTCLSQNGFRHFCEECGVASARSSHCKREHLDQLFVAVNVTLKDGAKGGELEEEGTNPKKLLNRREWVDAITNT